MFLYSLVVWEVAKLNEPEILLFDFVVGGLSVVAISDACLFNPTSPLLLLESALIYDEVVAFAYDEFRAR